MNVDEILDMAVLSTCNSTFNGVLYAMSHSQQGDDETCSQSSKPPWLGGPRRPRGMYVYLYTS